MNYQLHLTLHSDTTFGRGDGIAGLVDEEIEHDSATGLPYVRGRTLKGLLVEECANILYSLELAKLPCLVDFQKAAGFLFGNGGSLASDQGRLRVGNALLPQTLRQTVEEDVREGRLTGSAVLESLTSIRRQTAVNDETGAPDEGSLRSMRVLLRGITLVADLTLEQHPDPNTMALLSACAKGVRRGGIGRNRGRGSLDVELKDELGKPLPELFEQFKVAIGGTQ